MIQYQRKRITKLTRPMWDIVLADCLEQLKTKPDNLYLIETVTLLKEGYEPTVGNDGWEDAYNNFGKEKTPAVPGFIVRDWHPRMPPKGSSSEVGLTRKEYDRRKAAEKAELRAKKK